MLRPWINIRIGKEEFAYITDGEVVTTWKRFTDTAKVAIPRKVKKGNKTIFIGTDNLFKKGDFATISVGYFPNIEQIFEGYLTKITPNDVVEMEFEDASWILKQTNLTVSYKNISLEDLLNNCLNEAIKKASPAIKEGLEKVKIKAVEANFPAFRLTNVNVVQVLDELKKTYALTSFFRGETLFVGLAYNADGNKHKFEFQKDILDGHSLEYKKEDDVRLKVKVTSMLENNSKIEVEVGDPDGEQRSIFVYNVKDQAELKKIGEREKQRLVYEGFFGTFDTFIEPIVRHGDEIELIDPKHPEKNGFYYVEAVAPKFGTGGYFQTITLGVKISAN
ncbi:structural protein [Flavobacterium phage vB_FspM_lotta8-2]|uniref:Structural protein n=1 Tax=Flavobacterium phage vB_FspM_lotta8-2 TaxID=2686243 RepID=A0A6B9LB10_9CAUD|nr:structural protein [Flavobacterium phage vB_FspM_lotta8-2]